MIKISRLFILLFLLVNTVAEASVLTSVMVNTKHSFYYKTANVTSLSFEILAERFIEDFSQTGKPSLFLLSGLKTNKVTQYENGKLYFHNSVLNFKRAFWSQGYLVLTDAHGTLNLQTFNSPEIRFSENQMHVFANNITFISTDKLSRQLNFKQKVETLN